MISSPNSNRSLEELTTDLDRARVAYADAEIEYDRKVAVPLIGPFYAIPADCRRRAAYGRYNAAFQAWLRAYRAQVNVLRRVTVQPMPTRPRARNYAN